MATDNTGFSAEKLAQTLARERAGHTVELVRGVFGCWGIWVFLGHTVDERNPALPKKPWDTIVGWYFQGNHHSRLSQLLQDFILPQYLKGPSIWYAR